MQRTKLVALIGVLAVGFAAAALVAPRPALAWSPSNLPPGFRLTHTTVVGATVCPEYYQFIAPAVSNPFCLDSPTYQQDFDAWVDAHYTPPPTTTDGTTTALPPTTTSDPQSGGGTTPTDTTTTTVTVPAAGATVEERLAALEAEYAALAARVDAIAQANAASWDAFIKIIDGGGTAADAALAARSAGLNAIYGL